MDFINIAERQAQLPRTRVERLLNTVQQRGCRSKTDARLLGVSCSVLFGLHCGNLKRRFKDTNAAVYAIQAVLICKMQGIHANVIQNGK